MKESGNGIRQPSPAQKTSSRPVQRPVQPSVQKPGNIPARKPTVQRVQTQAKRVPQEPVHKNVQRPVQMSSGKTVSKPSENSGNIFKVLIVSALVLLLGLGITVAVLFIKDETELLIPEVTIEAGTVKPELSMFFSGEPAVSGLVSTNLNFDEVNYTLPQTVNFNIKMYFMNFPCKLYIQDTVPPSGEGIAQKIFACDEIPDASECVTGVEDITDVTATWKELPDMSAGGNFTAQALLTDGCGNETVVDVLFEVTKDSEAPVIEGAVDIEAYIGDGIAYRKNVKVTDDYDNAPELSIDTTGVDMNTEGTYEVIYTARDFSGNENSVTINLTLSEKPEGYVEPEEVYTVAKEILDEITEPGMTEEEIALQIVWWCRYNIRFILKTSSNSWTEAAYNAFLYRTGNCYSTVYAVKALLDVAGIENMIIERYPYQTATHFWNYVCLNGEWYHCDSTWREGYDSYFFMYTTEELLDFWQGGWNGFQFNQEKYPESASESVQDRIDYKNHTISDG